MKFIVISDTHGLHRDLVVPEGDVLVHCGDFCDVSNEAGVYDFIEWFDNQDFEYKVLIGGNHDFFASKYPQQFLALLSERIIYLNDSGTKIAGFNLWGSPVQPDLEGWAFGKSRGAAMKAHWDLIPLDTDILITHTPPFGILDRSTSGRQIGCEELAKKLYFLNLKAHLFGHVHASYGNEQHGDTLFINASNMKSNVGIVNEAVVLEF